MTTIQTTHAGSLPRSPELIEANAARPVGEDGLTPQPTEEFREVLRQAVVDVVAKQREIGISVPNDGEYGHLMGSAVNYGAWWSYIFDRVSGLDRKSTRLNSSHVAMSYAVFCLKKKYIMH